ncbi:MAG: MtnX-like HAD-IB family phosphatase [Candidatus Omnitrophica bacterium]|nr:MtnX-like HAD-IB family phosphatase [Candidatus Omnitrophota bacterium]
MVILTDFDGTITTKDVIDGILERFAGPEWLEIENQWLSGEIGSKECLRRQMALITVEASALEQVLNSVEIDSTFASFLQYCFAQEIPLRIVSDNFEWFIRHILRNNLPEHTHILDRTPIFANEVKLLGTRLEFSFPHSGPECTHGCATCKASLVKKIRANDKDEIIFIGDGMSDRFGAREADLVFAKSTLLEYCRKEGIEAIPFDQFSKIQGWVESKRKVPAPSWQPRKS